MSTQPESREEAIARLNKSASDLEARTAPPLSHEAAGQAAAGQQGGGQPAGQHQQRGQGRRDESVAGADAGEVHATILKDFSLETETWVFSLARNC